MSTRNAGRVAVVDDEENIRETVGYALKREGYRVDLYPDGLAAWEKFGQARPDVVVLDIVMPRMDGLELCRKIRGVTETLPIIFLTSRDEELDRVLGLELGGDDYLVKPFAVRELLARIKGMFRRLALLEKSGQEPEAKLALGELELDLARYQATWKGELLPLTVTEVLLLPALRGRPAPAT